MGGFFGITSKRDCLMDVFIGTDYHSHLGTRRGGLAAYDKEIGLQRKILRKLSFLTGKSGRKNIQKFGLQSYIHHPIRFKIHR